MSMSEHSSQRLSTNLLNLSAYFIVPAVGVPMLWTLFEENAPTRWIASGLLALFTLALFLRDRMIYRAPWGRYVYTGLQTLLIIALIWLPPHQLIAVVLFFVLCAEVTMMYSPRVAAAWLALFSAVTLIAYLSLSGVRGLVAVPIYIAGYVFFAVFASQTARAEAARAETQRLLAELQEAHRQLREYAAQAEELGVVEERNRLAREMHDTLGHRLTVSAVQLQAAERLIAADPDRATQMVGTVREQIREALGELRRTVATLRAPVTADLALAPAIRRLAGDFEQATGIAVHVALSDDLPPLPPGHRHALYRGVQEALTNVQKHAQAHDAWVQIVQQNGCVTLLVRDNGIGLASETGDALGFGLRGLRERAAVLGGDLRLQQVNGSGAELVMTLPLGGDDHA